MTEQTAQNSPKPSGQSRTFLARLRAFISSPLLNGLGMLFGLVVGFYFWQDGKSEPNLYGLSDTHGALQIVAAVTNSLEVRFDGKPVQGNVVAQQIKVWNRGKKPIKPSDILEPIAIEIEPKVRILDVQVKDQARPVISFEAGLKETSSPNMVGVTMVGGASDSRQLIGLNWKILEQSDGATIQVIYEGARDVQFKFVGAIEGQKKLTIENRRLDRKRAQTDQQSISIAPLIVMLFIVLLTTAASFLPTTGRAGVVKEWINAIAIAAMSIGAICLVGYIVYDIAFASPASPPF